MLREKRVVAWQMILIAALCAGCFKSKTEVTKIPTAAEISDGMKRLKRLDGVPYRLPRTVIQTAVVVNKSVKAPGEFEKFAPCFFSKEKADERITEKSTQFSIDSATFSTRGEPDPEQSYVAKVKGGYFENKSLLLEYSPTGVLQKGEAESKNEALEFTLKAAKTIAGIGGAIATSGGTTLTAAGPQETEDTASVVNEAKECYEFIYNYETQRGPEAERALTAAREAREKAENAFKKATRPEDRATKQRELRKAEAKLKAADELNKLLNEPPGNGVEAEKIKELERQLKVMQSVVPPRPPLQILTFGRSSSTSDPNESRRLLSDYQRAKQAFKRLQQARDKHDTMVTSAGNTPPETINILIKASQELIDLYESSFLGVETEKNWTGTLEYTPTNVSEQISPPFFLLSETEGICLKGLIKDQAIKVPPGFTYAKCDQELDPMLLTAVWLKVSRDSDSQDFRQQLSRANAESLYREKTRGWYYRIPSPATVSVLSGHYESKVQANAMQAIAYYFVPVYFSVNWNSSIPLETQRQNATREAGDKARDYFAKMGLPLDRSSQRSENDTPSQVAKDQLLVAQLGIVTSIPANGAGRTNQSSLVLDEATGALKNFKYSSNSLLESSMLDDVKSSADSIIDAKDPLKKKKRELDLLQTEKLIRDARKALENSDSKAP